MNSKDGQIVKKLDNSVYAMMVFGQVGKIDLFASNYLKEKTAPTMTQANEWYDKYLKKETYNMENQTCVATFFKDGAKKEANLEAEEGMESFKKMILEGNVMTLWMKTNALVIIGDIVETGAKYLKVDG